MFRPGPPLDRRELPPRFAFLDVEVDCEAARAKRAEGPLPLEPKAFDLLLLLAANPGRVVEKQEIFDRLWTDAVVTDNALARVVAQLRRELGDSAEEARVIETVRTRGYRFLPELTAIPGAPATPSAAAPAPRGMRRPGPIGVALVAGALALAALALWRACGRPAAVSDWTAAPVQLTIETGYRGAADFSPDGSQFVYSSDAAGGLQLFVRPLAGGRAIQITSGGGPKIDAAWSPDGSSIAFRDLAAGGLWLVAPTGGPPRQITDFGSQPAWFPGGGRLVFSNPGRPTLGAAEWPATYSSTLWTVELATGEVARLTEPDPVAGGQGMPAVSADGRWVYFATGRSVGGGALWRVAAAGGRPEHLLAPPEAAGRARDLQLWLDPTPAPAGDAVYAVEVGPTRRIVRVHLGEGHRTETVLAAAPAGVSLLALSKDGRRLIYTEERNRTSLEELALDRADGTGGSIHVLAAPATPRVQFPRYSPDGRRLLFVRRRPGIGFESIVLDRAGGEPREFTLEPTRAHWWLSDGRIAFGTPGSGGVIDLESGRRREGRPTEAGERILALAAPRAFAPTLDGRYIAFVGVSAAGAQELFRGDLVTGEIRQLTRLARSASHPFVSRDGRWFGFQVALESSADNELWRIPAAGGEPERLPTEPGPSWGGSFAPDGERVVYAAHRGGSWYLAVAGPRAPERRLDVPPETVGYLRWPDWSPDGRHIAFERMQHEAALWTIELRSGN